MESKELMIALPLKYNELNQSIDDAVNRTIMVMGFTRDHDKVFLARKRAALIIDILSQEFPKSKLFKKSKKEEATNA